MRRLAASGLLPERAGQPVKAWAHISLADLILLDARSALQDEWTSQVRERWAARRPQAAESGAADGGGLDGDAAEAIACAAAMAPIVTGDINIDALQDLVRLCVELDARRRDGTRDAAWAAIAQAVIGKAVDLVSGPGGLASFLRCRELGARLGGRSLPLDIGYAESVPAGIRNAVLLRDRHCQWAGGCTQPAGACQVHHTTHKARGGTTSVTDCVLLCPFHHQIVIHRWGWTLVVNPDGTTSAWNKNKTKVLHSHGPPARAGEQPRFGTPVGAVGRLHREQLDPELLEPADQPVQLCLVPDVPGQHGPVGAVLQGHPVERGLEALAEPSPQHDPVSARGHGQFLRCCAWE